MPKLRERISPEPFGTGRSASGRGYPSAFMAGANLRPTKMGGAHGHAARSRASRASSYESGGTFAALSVNEVPYSKFGLISSEKTLLATFRLMLFAPLCSARGRQDGDPRSAEASGPDKARPAKPSGTLKTRRIDTQATPGICVD